MKRKIWEISKVVIIIGVLAISINTIFGYGTITLIEKVRDINSGLWYYNINMDAYIKNLQTSLNETSVLMLELPTREWYWAQDITDFWYAFSNDMALILDYLILVINIIIYPMRVGAYLTKNMLAIMGYNVTNPPETYFKWIVDLIEYILPLQVPYIPS